MKTSPFHILQKFRFYTAINILGLALSLACTMLLVRYIYAELTVDHYNPDSDRLAFLTVQYEGNSVILMGSNANRNHDKQFVDPMNDPEVDIYTAYIPYPDEYIELNNKQFPVNILVTDRTFLQVTHYPLIAGDGSLNKPASAIISTELARKLYGESDPLGKTFIGHTGITLTVTGILGKPSTKSTLQFDVLISNDPGQYMGRREMNLARLASPDSYIALNKKNDRFFSLTGYSENIRMQFFPLKKLYYDQSILLSSNASIFLKGSAKNLWILSISAFLLLMIGIFNFINIYSVVMLKRAREFGLKRLFGINKKEVYLQLWKENLTIIVLALLIAWSAMEIMELLLARVFFIQLIRNIVFDLFLSVGLLIFLPIVTAVFPWFRFCHTPAWVSIRSVNTGGQSLISRKIFLFLQYAVTYSIVVISLFFARQIYFVLHYDYGYQVEDIIQCNFFKMVNEPVRISADGKVIPSERRIREQNNARILEEKLDASPLFLSWEFGQNPNQFNTTFFAAQFRVQGGEYKDCAYGSLSSGYMNMFNIKMKEGRMWDPKQDQNNGYKLMINETAKKLFGIDHIGEIRLESSRRLWYDPAVDYNSIANYEIVGVIEDFRSRHLSQPVLPLVISYTDKGRRDEQLILHIAPGKHQEAIAFVSDLYEELVGDGRFEYTSFEDEIAGLYAEDRKVATIYSSFALIAILVSAMGLFGLSLFDIRQRYREIALRKVNGATFKDIRKLLFIKYMRLILLSFAVAAPIAFLFLHRYLQDYSTHAPISWWIFAAAAILTMAVAMLTLLWQVQKASKLNPADAIRTE